MTKLTNLLIIFLHLLRQIGIDRHYFLPCVYPNAGEAPKTRWVYHWGPLFAKVSFKEFVETYEVKKQSLQIYSI